MHRFASAELVNWLHSQNRRPMVLRGARQVGKTWLVRDLADRTGLRLIELNFERMPAFSDLFSGNDPVEILKNIEAETGTTIDPKSSLLLLDEIQAAPELFSKLRWFKEEMPSLPVIAAGSLLDFSLKEYQYSMPVGRITYFFLEPMSFFEFLVATGNEQLHQKLLSFGFEKGIPQTLHEKCLALYQDYCLIGGMPEVAQEWIANQNMAACIKLQQDLLITFRDDFHKYGGEMDARLLAKIMLSVSEQLGNKFMYSRVDTSGRTTQIKKAFTLLSQAKVCTKVMYTSGNGLPLGAESNEKFFKAIMLDIGLVSVQLGLSSMKYSNIQDIIFKNKGEIAEQFVGQQLRSAQTPLTDPQLFYWQRTKRGSGEIDYVIQHGHRIVPIEVKSGSAGSMKSLHQFMADKKLDLAVRCNISPPSVEKISVKTTQGEQVSYCLISIPLYMVECLKNLIDRSF